MIDESKQYLFSKITEFKQKSCNPEQHLNSFASRDKDFKRQWKRDKEGIDYAGIKNNEQVLQYIEHYEGAVYFVENHVKRGHIEDAYNMYKGLYDALTALLKLAQNMDNTYCDFSELSEKEIDDIFIHLESIRKRMENANMHRAMQD